MTKPRDQYRQGHILLHPVSGIPLMAVRREPARVSDSGIPEWVLASGESGREHLFKSERVAIYQDGPDVFFEISGDDPVYLEHPEHGDIEVDPGCYKLVEQREAEEGEIGFGTLPERPSLD